MELFISRQLVLVLLVSAVSTANGLLYLKDQDPSLEQILFESFVGNHSKSYRADPATLQTRFEIFQQSLMRHKTLNDYERTHGGTAVYGVNQFSDLTPEEFEGMYLSPASKSDRGPDVPSNTDDTKNMDYRVGVKDTKFDWRDQGVIGPIRNQNRCGSCWAFAVVETIESAYAIKKKEKLKYILSSQQLISCDYNPSIGLDGCGGGILANAFKTLKDEQMVIVEEKIYPFQSSDGNNFPCQTNLPKQGMILTNYSYYQNIDVDSTRKLIHESPLTTSINAVAWQDYVGGIVQHHCNGRVDHAIQIVGYDLTGEVPYWIVRNTWGSRWGENGYIRILYGENMCGIRDEVAVVYDVTGVAL